MPDAVEFVKTMKKTAVDAVDATKPVSVCFGKVEAVAPLRINVEQKMVLGEAQLILSRNVTDYTIPVTADWQTESYTQPSSGGTVGETEPSGDPEHTHKFKTEGTSGNTHTHRIAGRKEMTIHNSLAVGDSVLLLRQQGGQKYIVMDRIGVM